MILDRLKMETQPYHDAIEKKLNLFDDRFSNTDYKNLLAKFYGYYFPLENRLRSVPHLFDIPLLYAERLKTELLRNDLKYLGCEIPKISLCTSLPKLETMHDVLGCLYVIEGATLGAQMIFKHVRSKFAVSPTTGGAFFYGYGQSTLANWAKFRDCLLKISIGLGEKEIINSAVATFLSLDAWLGATEGPTC